MSFHLVLTGYHLSVKTFGALTVTSFYLNLQSASRCGVERRSLYPQSWKITVKGHLFMVSATGCLQELMEILAYTYVVKQLDVKYFRISPWESVLGCSCCCWILRCFSFSIWSCSWMDQPPFRFFKVIIIFYNRFSQEKLSDMVIHSFATDANELVYPAITVCRHGYDPGLPHRQRKYFPTKI